MAADEWLTTELGFFVIPSIDPGFKGNIVFYRNHQITHFSDSFVDLTDKHITQNCH